MEFICRFLLVIQVVATFAPFDVTGDENFAHGATSAGASSNNNVSEKINSSAKLTSTSPSTTSLVDPGRSSRGRTPTPVPPESPDTQAVVNFVVERGIIAKRGRQLLEEQRSVRASRSIEGTWLWVVGLFGAFANGAVFLTIVYNRRSHRPLHVLLGTLAFTDLYISLIFIPSYTYSLLEYGMQYVEYSSSGRTPPETSGWSFCQVIRVLFLEMASVSLTIKMLIAMYLYVVTQCRTSASRLFRRTMVIFYVSLAALGNAMFIYLPSMFGGEILDFYPKTTVCDDVVVSHLETAVFRRKSVLSFLLTEAILAVHIVQLGIICICFIKVHCTISAAKRISLQQNKEDVKTDYVRAVKMTSAVFISYSFCWLPVYVLTIADPWHVWLSENLHRAALDLLLLKSTVNPFIYIYGVRSLRSDIKAFCLGCKKAPPRRRRHQCSSSCASDADSTCCDNMA